MGCDSVYYAGNMSYGLASDYRTLKQGGNYMKKTIEKIENGTVTETVSDPAVWELMYFGKACADEKYKSI